MGPSLPADRMRSDCAVEMVKAFVARVKRAGPRSALSEGDAIVRQTESSSQPCQPIVKPGLHGTETDFERFGDLDVCQTVQVVHAKHDLTRPWHRVERCVQGAHLIRMETQL